MNLICYLFDETKLDNANGIDICFTPVCILQINRVDVELKPLS
jgi:hypothetical protein